MYGRRGREKIVSEEKKREEKKRKKRRRVTVLVTVHTVAREVLILVQAACKLK